MNDTTATALAYGMPCLPEPDKPGKYVVFVDCGHTGTQVIIGNISASSNIFTETDILSRLLPEASTRESSTCWLAGLRIAEGEISMRKCANILQRILHNGMKSLFPVEINKPITFII